MESDSDESDGVIEIDPKGRYVPLADFVAPARNYPEISVTAAAYNWLGHQRKFEKDEESASPTKPLISPWRSNLVVLSHRHDLLFAVYDFDIIYVYKPRGQSEYIGKPLLKIKVPTSRPGLTGYNDPGHPHGINHLIAGLLGTKEIILFACDDGDVMAYYTYKIACEIEFKIVARENNSDPKPSEGCSQIRPFFHQNVNKSAWGLAIHTISRKIAVSSNTAIIHVFNFGLVSNTSKESTVSQDQWPVYAAPNNDDIGCNAHVRLNGHGTNTPTVAFDNSGQDPEGRYLISADIGNEVRVWDLWTGRATGAFGENGAFGSKLLEMRLDGSITMGWSCLCIDPASYWPTNTVVETFGCQGVSYCASPEYWDNSCNAALVPDNMSVHLRTSLLGNPHGPHPVDPRVELGLIPEQGGERSGLVIGSQRLWIDSVREARRKLTNSKARRKHATISTANTFSTSRVDKTIAVVNSKYPYQPRFDILVCTKTDINLIYQTPRVSKSDRNQQTRQGQENGHNKPTGSDLPTGHDQTTWRDPLPYNPRRKRQTRHNREEECGHIVCRDALAQRRPISEPNFAAFRRLNMVLQIRELGIVLVGCQTGRVAVISLTCMKDAPSIKSFRIDRILPTWSQEEEGLRPTMPLYGMALGPVDPGDETHSGVWRLMLFYYDHTILVYHIRRELNGSISTRQR